MKSQGNRNAVSGPTAAVLFTLLACAIAFCGALAGVEAAVLEFFLIAYVCIVLPLFLVGAMCSKAAPGKHRSFRVTPDRYMDGKRVRRRLQWIAAVSWLFGVAAAMLTYAGLLLASVRMGNPLRGKLWASLMVMGVSIAAGYLMYFLLKILYVRFGWMTREEARSFPFGMQKGRWPESWLEPDDQQAKPRDSQEDP